MSNGQVNTSNKSNLYGELRVAQGEILRAASSAPLSIRNDINLAVMDVIAGLEGVSQGQAEATRILSDMRYAPAEQYKQASAVMSKAFAGSAAANKALETAAASAKKALEASLLPKAPRDASEAAQLDRKQDLAALLAHTGDTPASKVAAVAKQLRRALQTGDQLSAFVLTSKMSFVYQANGMNADVLAQEFARVLGEPVDDDDGQDDARDPIPGAALLANLKAGGVNSVPGVLAVAAAKLYAAQTQWNAWLASVRAG
jgi:hypothetical protein